MNSMKSVPMLIALSLLVAGTALNASLAQGADWIKKEAYTDAWVERVEKELNKETYRWLFANDPRAPQANIVRLLDQAAAAHQAGNDELARSFVDQAIGVLKKGVERHYYSMSDIDPVIAFIREVTPVKT